ncbi:MAG: amidohydrolase family protein [Myxococcota bacterium]
MAERRMLIRNADFDGGRIDLRIVDGRVAETGTDLDPHDGAVVEAGGGALLPGLRDHHVHAQSLAAALASVRCGPPTIQDAADLARTLAAAAPVAGWIRGTGYFESVAGDLDRDALDRFRDDVAVRIQHRSGVMWFLNSKAIEALDLGAAARPGLERDDRGRITGRFFRADAWLRAHLPEAPPPDLARVGRYFAARGVTELTDCTPSNDATDYARFVEARSSGDLPQRVTVMGTLGLEATTASVAVGAHKIMLDEPALPDLDRLIERIRAAHAEERSVAFHAVTRTEIQFALAALEAAGPSGGDRMEHASIAPPETIDAIRRLRVTVVTQPNFVGERGDDYLRDVEPRDRPHLYRVKSWRDACVRLHFGTDAPFGEPDPWAALEAAVTRRTPSGRVLGEDERLAPDEALRHFLAIDDPRADGFEPGRPADLCLLDRPWTEAAAHLSDVRVVQTWLGGEPLLPRDDTGGDGLHTSLQSGHRGERSTA